jgi:integrase/recombinase XerD
MNTDLVTTNQNPEIVNRTPYGKHSDNSRLISFLSESEVNAMAAAAKTMRAGDRNELLILDTFQLALRISETLQLTKQHRVFMNGKPRLAILGKGNKPRIVAVPEVLSYRLGDFIGSHNMGDTDKLFPISRQRAWRIIKQCAVKAGIDRRVYCHLLRHGGAIARLKRSGNPKSLQIHLGHSDIKMTMRYLSTLQLMESLEIEDKVKF